MTDIRDAAMDHAVRVLVEERMRMARTYGAPGIAEMLGAILVDARQALEDIDTLAASGLSVGRPLAPISELELRGQDGDR
jgi:hypothetical protein